MPKPQRLTKKNIEIHWGRQRGVSTKNHLTSLKFTETHWSCSHTPKVTMVHTILLKSLKFIELHGNSLDLSLPQT